MRAVALLGVALLAITPAPTVVRAQGAPPAGVQCLTRSFADANGNAQPLTIFVPSAEAGTYSAKGFVAGACGSMSVTAYRAESCRVARLGNEAVQARLTQILGARPQDLCDSVKRAAPYPADPGN